MHLIDFWIKTVPSSPISGHFGRELRCLSKFAVATTGKEGRLCSSRLGKRFVLKAN